MTLECAKAILKDARETMDSDETYGLSTPEETAVCTAAGDKRGSAIFVRKTTYRAETRSSGLTAKDAGA